MKDISNLRSGRTNRSAFLLVPVGLSILCMAGVAFRPAKKLHEARRNLQRAEQRMDRFGELRRNVDRYRAERGLERTEEALQRARGLLPQERTELELHSLLRVLAKKNGLRLDSLLIGDSADPGFPRLGDAVGLREISLRGKGAVRDFRRLVSALRSLGLPVAVLELALERSKTDGSQFHVQAVIGLFESVEIPAETTERTDSNEVESP